MKALFLMWMSVFRVQYCEIEVLMRITRLIVTVGYGSFSVCVFDVIYLDVLLALHSHRVRDDDDSVIHTAAVKTQEQEQIVEVKKILSNER